MKPVREYFSPRCECGHTRFRIRRTRRKQHDYGETTERLLACKACRAEFWIRTVPEDEPGSECFMNFVGI